MGMIKKYQYHGVITEYQKTINLLENTPNQSSKFIAELGWDK